MEPYRHVLKRLTSEDISIMPFRDQIVFAGKQQVSYNPRLNQRIRSCEDKPDYLDGISTYDLSCLMEKGFEMFNKNVKIDRKRWDYESMMKLNAKQIEALKLALTTRLALIQGPPGTGKTHISVQILNVLLKNESAWRLTDDGQNAPVVIICFTNHALDELLKKTFDVCDKDDILRFGSQSKDEELDKLTINSWRANYSGKYPRKIFCEYIKVKREQEELVDELKTLCKRQNEIRFGSPKIELLQRFITHDKRHLLSLLNGAISANLLEGIDQNDYEKLLKVKKRSMGDLGFRDWLGFDQYFKEELSSMSPKKDTPREQFWQAKLNKWLLKPEFKELAQLTPGYESEFDSLDTLPMNHFANFFSSSQPAYMSRRLKFFTYLKKTATHAIQREIDHLTPDLVRTNADVNNQRNALDIEICREKKIIGLTTTAAARVAPMLEALGSKIILCEEASEVLESHTIASLTPAVEHMIMIGDHQQLRPKPSNNDLAWEKNLDIPLFEVKTS